VKAGRGISDRPDLKGYWPIEFCCESGRMFLFFRRKYRERIRFAS
jgi:hypothetical protein